MSIISKLKERYEKKKVFRETSREAKYEAKFKRLEKLEVKLKAKEKKLQKVKIPKPALRRAAVSPRGMVSNSLFIPGLGKKQPRKKFKDHDIVGLGEIGKTKGGILG